MSVAQDKHLVGNFTVDGEAQVKRERTRVVAASTYTVVALDYGTTIFFTYAGGVAVTLPAAGAIAGTSFRLVNANSNTTAVTASTPVADNLIAFNNATADSVTHATGERIASSVLYISNGTYWVAINQNGACAMTVTDT